MKPYKLWGLGLYAILWLWSAIDPFSRSDWLLENLLVFIGLPVVLWLDRRYDLSPIAFGATLLFFALHSIGAHYTYAEMPIFHWIAQWLGISRNHYDRVVHFMFGFLLFRPMFECFLKAGHLSGTAGLLTLFILISLSSLYEILEWLVVIIAYPELGAQFLGIQGDEWDSQKDHALGTLGALLGYIINRCTFGHPSMPK